MHPTAFKFFINKILPDIPQDIEEISASVVAHLYTAIMGDVKTFLIPQNKIAATAKEMDARFPPDYKYACGWRSTPSSADVEKALKHNYVLGGCVGVVWEPNAANKSWVKKEIMQVAARKPKAAESEKITFFATIKFIPK